MKQKNYNIEIIRLISSVMVIVIHVTNYFCRAYGTISMGEYIFAFALNSISRISVPCFFMISGFFLLGKTEPISEAMKRVMRFSGVLVLWTFVFYIFNNYYTHQPCDWKQLWKTPAEAHLWYLYAIIPLYLLLPLGQKLFKKISARAGTILAVIFGAVCTCAFVFQINLPLQYMYFFILGHIIAQNLHRFPLKQGHWLAIFISCNILNIICGVVKTLDLGEYAEIFTQYRNPLIVLSAVSFFIFVMQLKEGKVCLSEKLQKGVEICCACSFGMYLIQIIFLDIYKQNFTVNTFSAYVVIPLLTAVIVVISVGSVYLMRKTTFGRKIT